MRMWDAMPVFSIFSMVFALLVTVALVVGIILLVRALSDGPGQGRASTDALRVLEERYARGEIDRDEFLQRRDDLRS